MSTAAREIRIAVMMLAEVSWEDATGKLQSASARLEDKSQSGACIRMKKPVEVGTKLRVWGRFEEFSGVVRYCRSEDWDYVVGLQRESESASTEKQATVQDGSAFHGETASKAAAAKPAIKNGSDKRMASGPAVAPMREDDRGMDGETGQAISGHRPDRIRPANDFGAHRRSRFRAMHQARVREAPREKKSMARKWLELAPWQNKRESASVKTAESSEHGQSVKGRENSMQQADLSAKKEAEDRKTECVSGFQIDLLPMEDIYQAAGIANSKKGYSIHKVVEMLNSEHMVGLANETKRAAVMVALEAADISLGQVQQDAKTRQEALDRYEVEQTKLIEAEWARKAEENIRIEEELERVKAQYAARVKRNLDEAAREKSKFDRWLAMKQQEVKSISAAMDLCLKREVAEPGRAPLTNAAAAGAGSSPALLASSTKS
ncbi:MAG: hypothetical protein WAK27_11395 [Candidatus Sulfotelmatobacter sp.]